MTSAQDLNKFARETLGNKKFVLATQREPYMHVYTPEGIKIEKTIGGAGVLLDGILRKTGGLMVAMASGNADDQANTGEGKIKLPPGEESYLLKRVFLTKKEIDRFYYGFSNQTLWPLCHAVFTKPVFRSSWWNAYVRINQRFAKAILDEIKDEEAFIWVNDYQLALLPKMLREKRPDLSIGIFWHIPWPTLELFRICPWRHDILEGMLGADFVGFHRHYHVENFIDCLREEIGVIVESEPRSVLYKKRLTKITHLPTGIDTEEIDQKVKECVGDGHQMIEQDLGIKLNCPKLILGVDRVDYTKGLLERFRMLDRLFEKYPQYQKQVTYVSIGVPSRLPIPAYKTYNRKIQRLVERINAKYKQGDWQPIHFVNRGVDRDRLFCYYRAADVGLVTPLDDGMNLVAKEFAISTNPEKGILVVSRFAGAAKDLYSAMHVNPYDTEQSADAIHYSLIMSPEEKKNRNADMRRVIEENNIYRWGIEFIRNTNTENLTHKYL
ncbi:MAG: trehalose-6-phosphate synthase [Candidatus Andersenbacteria bacterium]|nr:trehalose-6-phosphate synthase [Candidatus Andersenbacteria bacterium]